MKGYYDLHTISDASEFVNQCLAEAESGREQRHIVAGWICGLGKLDAWDLWQDNCPEFATVHSMAGDAEIDEYTANSYWPDLIAAAKRLEAVAES